MAHRVSLLGSRLDAGEFPEVLNGGLLRAPSRSVRTQQLGAETHNDRARSSSASGTSSTGTSADAFPEGTSQPARETGSASSIERASVRASYENQIDAVLVAYPGTRVWRDEEGMWLLSESALIAGLGRAAIFLTGICWRECAVKAWGFWRCAVASVRWIGPRHTNFPDGSACAFDPQDGSWAFGDGLVELLDIYTVWALRHLHLEMFHRWPGPQSVFHPYERRLEFQLDERCGCGSDRRYRECCAPRDAARNPLSDAVGFAVRFAGGLREPPAWLGPVMLNGEAPPHISAMRWK